MAVYESTQIQLLKMNKLNYIAAVLFVAVFVYGILSSQRIFFILGLAFIGCWIFASYIIWMAQNMDG